MENLTETSSATTPTCSQPSFFYPYWAYMDYKGEWVDFYRPNVPYVLMAALQLPNGTVLLVRHPVTQWMNGWQISVAEDMTNRHISIVRNSSFPPPSVADITEL
jgi:hypothetical protein